MPALMNQAFITQAQLQEILGSLAKLNIQSEDKENEQANLGLSDAESQFMKAHCIDLIKAKLADKALKKEVEAP